ncbi:MAG TPA: nucleoside deaminase [Terriglobales bacterium]|nr:nucleoside deaminase [Terriglobales bacterium]
MSSGTNPFMAEAIELSLRNVREGKGGPFAAVIVKNGKVIARGQNQVTSTNDPTAHAEVVAIREACKVLGTFQLTGCDIFTSCEPCPMCLAAIYWARPARVFFGNTKEDAAAAGFDDSLIYDEIGLPRDQRKIPLECMMRDEAKAAFKEWETSPLKVEY